jgi:hypothetical protein
MYARFINTRICKVVDIRKIYKHVYICYVCRYKQDLQIYARFEDTCTRKGYQYVYRCKQSL